MLSLFYLVIVALPSLGAATCTSFTNLSAIYYVSDTRQTQQIGNGTACNNGTLVNPRFSVEGACHVPGTPNNSYGCILGVVGGQIKAQGYTNLTGLAATDEAALFALVATTFGNIYCLNSSEPLGRPGISVTSNLNYGFSQSASGCIDPAFQGLNFTGFATSTQPEDCLADGQAGYAAVTPNLKCINGTLNGCSGGPVTDGTPMAICGVGEFMATQTGVKGLNPMSFPAFLTYEFVNTTMEEAVNGTFAMDPAYNSTCIAYYQKEGWKLASAAAGRKTDSCGSRLFYGAVVAVMAGAFWV